MEVILFGDIEEAVRAALATRLAARGSDATAHCSIPNPRPTAFVVVQRTGGPRRDIITDSARLTIDCYAQTGQSALALAQLVRAIVYSLAGTFTGGLAIQRVIDVSGPTLAPDPSSGMPRYKLMCQVDYRGVPEA